MGYVLGDAASTGAPLRLQFTCAGDGWDTLARAYGVATNDIIAMQPELKNIAINNKSVQAFVKGRPGWSPADGLFPYNSANNPGTSDAAGKPEGFAHFTATTQLMLPDMPRLDGKAPAGSATIPAIDVGAGVSQASMGPVAILLGLGAAGLLFFGMKKDDKKKSA